MIPFLSAVIVAIAVLWAGWRIVRELKATREEEARARVLQLLALFSPGIGAVLDDPRALLTWQPLAATAGQLLSTFFTRRIDTVPMAMARVTALNNLSIGRRGSADLDHRQRFAPLSLGPGGHS